MKILTFDTIDSTSSFAARVLDDANADIKAPFAVVARQQTSGRGRSGKSWESPEGNLYLTLVLKPDQHPTPEDRGSLTLWVAAQVASWLQQNFGIRLTIKWPNDLLFAGRKLAGILCESRLHGNDWGEAVIGIGINLFQAPEVAEQSTASVAEILGDHQPFDPLALGKSLAEFIVAQTARRDYRPTYDAFALEPGQILKHDESGRYATIEGITSSGALKVRRLGSQDGETITSVSHGYRWIYQLAQPQPLLLADIGNSLIKLAYFADARQSAAPEVLRIDLREEAKEAKLKDLVSRIGLRRPWIVHGISVAQRPRDLLANLLAPYALTLVEVPKRPIRVDFSRYNFNQLGVDRTALAEAARAIYPAQNLLVVSAGTAMTIEAVSAAGTYLGGYILGGLQSKLNSLHLRTDRLPLLKIHEEDLAQDLPLFGRDTKSAMLSGLVHESIALVSYLQQQMAKGGGAPFKVVLTGGDGEVLSRFIDGDHRSDLVLEGVRHMVLGGLFC